MVEVAVAGAVMAILMGIAVMTYIQFQDSGSDTRAEVTLTRMLAAERSYYSGNQKYAVAEGTDLSAGEMSRLPEGISITTPSGSASTNVSTLSVAVSGDSSELGVVVLSESDDCWYLAANASGEYSIGVLSPGTCTANRAMAFVPAPS